MRYFFFSLIVAGWLLAGCSGSKDTADSEPTAEEEQVGEEEQAADEEEQVAEEEEQVAEEEEPPAVAVHCVPEGTNLSLESSQDVKDVKAW